DAVTAGVAGHRAGAVAGDRQAADAGHVYRAVGGHQRSLPVPYTTLFRSDADGIAVGRRERERAVLVHRLSHRHRVDRRVVHGVDGDGDGAGIAEGAAGAGVALVVGGDGDVRRAVVVACRLEDQAVPCRVD